MARPCAFVMALPTPVPSIEKSTCLPGQEDAALPVPRDPQQRQALGAGLARHDRERAVAVDCHGPDDAARRNDLDDAGKEHVEVGIGWTQGLPQEHGKSRNGKRGW